MAQALAPEIGNKGRPVFAVWMGGDDVEEGVQILNAAGIPTFETPEQAVGAPSWRCMFIPVTWSSCRTPRPRQTQELSVNTRQARTFLAQRLERQGGVLTELESKAILSAYDRTR